MIHRVLVSIADVGNVEAWEATGFVKDTNAVRGIGGPVPVRVPALAPDLGITCSPIPRMYI